MYYLLSVIPIPFNKGDEKNYKLGCVSLCNRLQLHKLQMNGEMLSHRGSLLSGTVPCVPASASGTTPAKLAFC